MSRCWSSDVCWWYSCIHTYMRKEQLLQISCRSIWKQTIAHWLQKSCLIFNVRKKSVFMLWNMAHTNWPRCHDQQINQLIRFLRSNIGLMLESVHCHTENTNMPAANLQKKLICRFISKNHFLTRRSGAHQTFPADWFQVPTVNTPSMNHQLHIQNNLFHIYFQSIEETWKLENQK